MGKYVFSLIVALLFSSIALGVASNRVYYHIDILDEWGELITTATQVTVQNTSGTGVAVYSTKSGTTEVGTTGVITTGISDGKIEFWYADTAIDLTVTDGTRSYEIESFGVRDHRFMLPSFLTATSGHNMGQTDDIDFTFASWIIDGDTANRLDMIPDNDAAVLAIGDSSTQADVYIYSSSTDYLFFDESTKKLEFVDIDADLDDDAMMNIGTDNDASLNWDNTTGDLNLNVTGILDIDASDDITLDCAGAAGQDIIITNTGGSVLLSASEDVTDAINIDATAGGIDIDAVGAAGQDIVITNTGGSISLVATEAIADAIVLNASTAAGGIDITSNADIDITTTGAATEDISITNTGGSIIITATENDAGAILIVTNGGSSEELNLTNTQGTAVTAIDIDATAGGIQLTAVDDIELALTAGTAGEDILITSSGAADSSITITSAGTGDDAISLNTSAGGINIVMAGGTAGEDFEITTATSIDFSSSEAAADQFKMDATGTIAGYAINFETTDGGILLNADGASNGDISVDAADDMTLTAAGNLTLAVTGTYSLGGAAVTNALLPITTSAATPVTVTAAESGQVFVSNYTGTLTWNLPAAAAGYIYTFIDNSATAADDVIVDIDAADNIEGDTNGDGVICTDDVVGSSITLLAISATRWIVISKTGTWAAQ